MSPLEDDVTASETLAEEDKTLRELDPFVLDHPRKSRGATGHQWRQQDGGGVDQWPRPSI